MLLQEPQRADRDQAEPCSQSTTQDQGSLQNPHTAETVEIDISKACLDSWRTGVWSLLL